MLRRLVNELTITVEIKTEGKSALLVKDGRYTTDLKKAIEGRNDRLKNQLPGALFMCTDSIAHIKASLAAPANVNLPEDHADQALKKFNYYIAGSSIRGAWRSHLEKTLRGLDETPKVCDPLVTAEGQEPEFPTLRSCSAVLANKDENRGDFPYHDSCAVCRLFGNTATSGRLLFSDAKKTHGTPELIDGVSISRFTGSAYNKFRTMGLRDARFQLTLRLRNFELWHVGLLGHLFDDLKAARVPLGSGRSRGFGAVSAESKSIELTEFVMSKDGWPGRLRGVAELCTAEEIQRYGFIEDGEPPEVEARPLQQQSFAWRRSLEITDAEFWKKVKPCFTQHTWDQIPGLNKLRAKAGA